MTILKEKYQDAREFEFTLNDFARVRTLIYQHAGISLSEAKKDMVYSRVGRRLRARNQDSFKTYLDYLEKSHDAAELEAFTNALTTNLTSFFREEHHFPVLESHLKKISRPIRIWCSAASTGEEPYSIAMTACKAFGTLSPPVEIIATDIDTNVLTTASQGIYNDERVGKLSEKQLKDFFQRGVGHHAGKVRVRKELRKLITFHQLNLLDDAWPFSSPFDAIFCRNVMIYFDKPTQANILAGFERYMKKDTLLFAGHSENFLYISKAFQLLGKTVYQLKASDSQRTTTTKTAKSSARHTEEII